MNQDGSIPSVDELRARARALHGQALWRSLEELAGNGAFERNIQPEFPGGIEGPATADLSRRSLLQLMGASLALAGLAALPGCSDKPRDERIVPYVNPPESLLPGEPSIYATSMPMEGYAKGVLVTCDQGRPIKIEGNPAHPASLGGTDAFMQASILSLYDPDRAKVVSCGGQVSTWGAFWEALKHRLTQEHAAGGSGIRILSSPLHSPLLADQKQQLRRQFPQARWHEFAPLSRENITQGSRLAYGRPLQVAFDLSHAKVIVSLDSNFLVDEPGSLHYARQFAEGRRVRHDRLEMSRLYMLESTLSITGSMADHRLAVRPSIIEQFAWALAAQLDISADPSPLPSDDRLLPWVRSIVADLNAHRGQCLIIAGESQPPPIHALVHTMNVALNNIGNTVRYIEPFDSKEEPHSLAALVADMQAQRVSTLLILSGNPAYDGPADLQFAAELERFSKRRAEDGTLANFSARLGLYDDETSYLCQWHLPEAHYLESWGDLRAFDGTASLLQPLILPLYQGVSIHEFCDGLLGHPGRSGHEMVREFWRSRYSGTDYESWWRSSLKTGVIEGSAPPPAEVAAPSAVAYAAGSQGEDGFEITFRPDYSVRDGSFANNGWLQELPRPFTKLTWDNAALVSPSAASRLQLVDEDVVELRLGDRSVEAPVLVVPGLPPEVITVHLGYGRSRAGNIGTDREVEWGRRGFDAYRLRTRDARWSGRGLKITRTGKKRRLVTTRSHHAMAGLQAVDDQTGFRGPAPEAIVTDGSQADHRLMQNRRLVRVGTLAEFKANPDFVKQLGGQAENKPLLSLYPGPQEGGWDYSRGYQWGMSIDMSACMGCNACMVACQAENNIPVVGKQQVHWQREMHWIRIDDYFGGSLDDPKVHHQPVPCMHCENAPCEYVCPTGATTHSAEGLNQMTYNRCVGTRYCSNNCPYKVRRFNFLSFADMETNEPRNLQRNPDVTVRTNGVMEKCSYCIQRIQRTRIAVEKLMVDLSERAQAADSDDSKRQMLEQAKQREFEMIEQLQTACQQACPTQAIVFGSINPIGSKQTQVARLKDEPLDYSLLRELTTKPRTTYLARVLNPNAEFVMEGKAS